MLPFADNGEEDELRAVALDFTRDFCEVAVVEDGELRSAGRVETTPEALELFDRSHAHLLRDLGDELRRQALAAQA